MLKSEWFWTAVITVLFFGLSLGGGYYLGSRVSSSGFIILTLLSIIAVMITIYIGNEGLTSFVISFFLCFFVSLLAGFLLYSWRLLLSF